MWSLPKGRLSVSLPVESCDGGAPGGHLLSSWILPPKTEVRQHILSFSDPAGPTFRISNVKDRVNLWVHCCKVYEAALKGNTSIKSTFFTRLGDFF